MAGTLTATTIQNDTSSPPTFNNNSVEIGRLCRAWIRFNAQANPVTVYGNFNVSSVTYVDGSTFTLNFTNAMPNGNYAATAMGEWRNGTSNAGIVTMDRNYPPQTTSLTVTYSGAGGGASLYFYINVAVFA
jgi:hypothetical protein